MHSKDYENVEKMLEYQIQRNSVRFFEFTNVVTRLRIFMHL